MPKAILNIVLTLVAILVALLAIHQLNYTFLQGHDQAAIVLSSLVTAVILKVTGYVGR